MNALFTVWRSLGWSRPSFGRVTLLIIDTCLHLSLIFWTIRRNWGWRRWSCSMFGWAFLCSWSFDVNNFAVPMIASDCVVTLARVWVWSGTQGWSRNVPRLFVIHLGKNGKHHMLIISIFTFSWRKRRWWNSVSRCVNMTTIKENECFATVNKITSLQHDSRELARQSQKHDKASNQGTDAESKLRY